MIVLFHLGALTLYAFAALSLGASLARGSRTYAPAATRASTAGAVLHALGLATYAARAGALPLAGLGPVLSSLALLIAAGSTIVATTRRAPLGLVLIPLAAALTGTALLVGITPAVGVETERGADFTLHVALAVGAYAGLAVAFAAGLMYLLQFRELKSKRFGAVYRFFPPLDTLDRLAGGALWFGIAALTLALGLGWTYSVRVGAAEPRNPEVIWGVLTWIVFAAALLARGVGARRGYATALACVLGFIVVVFAYLLLRLQLPGRGAFL